MWAAISSLMSMGYQIEGKWMPGELETAVLTHDDVKPMRWTYLENGFIYLTNQESYLKGRTLTNSLSHMLSYLRRPNA